MNFLYTNIPDHVASYLWNRLPSSEGNSTFKLSRNVAKLQIAKLPKGDYENTLIFFKEGTFRVTSLRSAKSSWTEKGIEIGFYT